MSIRHCVGDVASALMCTSNSSSSVFLSRSPCCCPENFDGFFLSSSFFPALAAREKIDLMNHRTVSFFFPSLMSSTFFLIADCSFSATGANRIWKLSFSSPCTLENAERILSIGSASNESYVFRGNASGFVYVYVPHPRNFPASKILGCSI